MPRTRRDANVMEDLGEDAVSPEHAGDAVEDARPQPRHMEATLPHEFITSLVESITRAQAEANKSLLENLLLPNTQLRASTPLSSAGAGYGNFSKCTARFNGATKDAEVVEAFIDAVEIYKECTGVSDEHALRGLPMLLEGDAAIWWRGARSTVTTWQDAISRLRGVYGVVLPAYKLLRQIFANEQRDDERADVFVCNIRALIARLPYVLNERLQVDIIYGLLHRRIRKRIPHDSIVNVDTLIDRARVTEDAISEIKFSVLDKQVIPSNSKHVSEKSLDGSGNRSVIPPVRTKPDRVRCSYCRLYGHTAEECRSAHTKTVKSEHETVSGDDIPIKPITNQENYSRSNAIRCYGCGKPGVVRSRCETCSNRVASLNEADFNSVVMENVSPHPMVNVTIMGKQGVAIVDTGATHCIASPMLYEILLHNNVNFRREQRTVGLADGTNLAREVLVADVPVVIEGREVLADFMVLPGDKTRTLLGCNFLANAGIRIDAPQDSWAFADEGDRWYPFVRSYTFKTGDEELTQVRTADPSLRADEEACLDGKQKGMLNQFGVDVAPQSLRSGPTTDFAIHTIEVSEAREPVESTPYRLSQGKKDTLKSHRAREKVKFLGHIIASGGIEVDPDKVRVIAGIRTPRNVKQLKSFLRMTGWFHRFVPNYAEVARPLTKVLKKRAVWQWSEGHQEAFERIKSLLVSAPILSQADETKPFVIRTDSSGCCLRAVLMQGEGPEERPIEYASRLLTSAEQNYSTTEREALAVVWAVGKFRGYIERSEVVVKSDHQPLRWLMSIKGPSGRLARWASTLQEFNLRVEYKPGKSNVTADMLSRPPDEETESDLRLAVVHLQGRSPEDVRLNQLKDPKVKKILDDLEEEDDPSRGRLWSDSGYVVLEGVLYRYHPDAEDDNVACLVVPLHERESIVKQYHDAPTAGHFGVERTLHQLCSRFYWPGMRTFVSNYIKTCVHCRRYHVSNLTPLVGNVEPRLRGSVGVEGRADLLRSYPNCEGA